MDFILWRHADAERGGRDEERKLTAKGRKQAKRVAAWLRERLPRDVTVSTNSIDRLTKRTSRPMRSGSFTRDKERRAHARDGAGVWLKRLQPVSSLAYRRRRPKAS